MKNRGKNNQKTLFANENWKKSFFGIGNCKE